MSAPTAQRRVTPTAVRVLPADADRDTWLTARRRGIGSSDVAAILGVAAKRTALHVWHDKHGRLPEEDAGEAALWGTLHEETVAREWARRNRAVVRRVGLIAHAEHPWRLCTLDRQIAECPIQRPGDQRKGACALEVKTRNAFVAGKWRRDVPDDVLAQVVWAMAVTGYDHMHVAVLIGGNDYRQYTIRRDEALMADVVTAVDRFWSDSIVGGSRPNVDFDEYAEEVIDLENWLHPDRSGSTRVDGLAAYEAIRAYELGRLAEKAGKRAKDAAKARLVGMLDGGSTAVDGDRLLYTYEPANRTSINAARLAERWPDAYADCAAEKSSPTLALARDLRLTEEMTSGE